MNFNPTSETYSLYQDKFLLLMTKGLLDICDLDCPLSAARYTAQDTPHQQQLQRLVVYYFWLPSPSDIPLQKRKTKKSTIPSVGSSTNGLSS